ncbi:helix-turn-helix domain-containing protein [Nocardia sp. NPDC052566]|uniref:helix-turn-helix domain-containing protein n=1 Tax=Nocardia sp. NPDC052566 TaxID=3364330 RepID=UPI0037C53EF3
MVAEMWLLGDVSAADGAVLVTRSMDSGKAPVDAGVEPWGRRLWRFRRLELGLSQARFAELLQAKGSEWRLNIGCDQRHVARWESGAVKPGTEYVEILNAVGAPVPDSFSFASPQGLRECLGSPPNTPSGQHGLSAPFTTVEFARGDGFLEAIASATVGSPDSLAPWLPAMAAGPSVASAVTTADVDSLRGITANLRQVDQRHGGLMVVDSAAAHLRSSVGLIAGCTDVATIGSLKMHLADLARLVGWSSHDVGDQSHARRYLALALLFAREARADSLVASCLYVLGRISLLERDPEVALRMFQLGQIPAQDASNGGESARLYMQEAWAHAMMGHERHMKDSLARAEQGIGCVVDAVDPWTQVFFTAGEFEGNTAVILNEFALATSDSAVADRYTVAAVEHARASLASSTPDRPLRSLLFDHTTVASCCFRLRELDSALASATEALALTEAVQSARTVDRLHAMVRAAAPSLRKSGVKEICRQVRQLALPCRAE